MGLYIAPVAKSTIVLGQNKMMSAINTINNFIFLITSESGVFLYLTIGF